MLARTAIALSILAAPASAAFLHGNLLGTAAFPATADPLPDTMALSVKFLTYRASPDLPQIGGDLGSYNIVLRAVAAPGSASSDNPRQYSVSGGIWRDGKLADRLLPKFSEVTVDPDTGAARLFLTLDFARPTSAPWLDFRPANGFALDGLITMNGAGSGDFSGKLVTAVAAVPESAAVALLGFGAFALVTAHRTRPSAMRTR